MNKVEFWCYMIVVAEILLFVRFVAGMLISSIKATKEFRKECRDKGLDWRKESEELQLLIDMLRTFGLKF